MQIELFFVKYLEELFVIFLRIYLKLNLFFLIDYYFEIKYTNKEITFYVITYKRFEQYR